MSNLFYRNRQLLVLTLVLIGVWGLSSFLTLPRLEDPELTQRTAVITTRFPGATAERVETLVTDRLEDELFDIEEIDTLVSTSRSGLSSVTVELLETVRHVDDVWSRVRDEIDDAVPLMPAEVLDPEFEIIEVRANALVVSLNWTADTPANFAILRRLATRLEDDLRQIPGTEDIEFYGEPVEEIAVEIDPATLTTLGLTADELSRQIVQSDAKVSAGQLRGQSSDLLFEVSDELSSLDRIRSIPIRTGGSGQMARLGDIARVEKGIVDPPAARSLVSGRPAIALGTLVESGRRIDQWAAQAHSVLEEFTANLPRGVELEVILDQSQFVQARLDGVLQNLMLAAVLVVAVTLVLMGWQAAVIVGSALPLSVLMVFGGMTLMGVPLHQMSVTGLILALGLLIDNAIVIVDEVLSERRFGRTPAQAVAHSVTKMAIPLGASTLTTVLAFMPIALAPGGVGEFTGTIAVSVMLAVGSSLFLALTVIPALAGLMHRSAGDRHLPQFLVTGYSHPQLTRLYRQVLRRVLARPVLGIGLALVVPVLGFIQAGSLSQQFFPPTDRNQFYIDFELPVQASLAETQRSVAAARDLIRQRPEVDDVAWFVGETAPTFYYNVLMQRSDAANFAQGLVQLQPGTLPQATIRELQLELDRAFPQAQILVRQLEQGPPFDAPVEVRLFGPDPEQLRGLGDRLRGIMAQVPDVVHTKATLSEALPKLGLHLDEDEVRLTGLDRAAIARQLDTTLEGAVGGSVLEETEELPVRVRLAGADRRQLDGIASLDLLAAGDRPIPLDAVGEIDLVPDRAVIARRDGQRVNTIQGFITAGVLPADALAQFKQAWDDSDLELPVGYRVEFGGEADARGTALGNLFSTVGVLAVLMAATLVLSLGSFWLAGTIGAIAVCAIGLALAALWMFGQPLGFMAILGSLGLVGLAINDSIVVLVVLRSNPLARQGDLQAMESTIVRGTRHVVTTTLTTMTGFVPLLLDPSGFWPPLAIAIAGGLGGATLLALFFVPSVYLMLVRRGWLALGDGGHKRAYHGISHI